MTDTNSTLHRSSLFAALFAVALGVSLSLSLRGAVSDARQEIAAIQQLLEKGDFAAARARLAQALREFPDEAAFYNFQGVVEAQSGNDQAAELNFQEALEKAPQFTGAYLNLGRFYQQNAGKIPQAAKKALGTYARLLKYEPGNLEANYQAAYLLELQGSYRASLEHLARLPAEAQGRSQALAVRLGDYAGLGEHAQADAAAEALARTADLSEADVQSVLPALEKHKARSLAVKVLAALAARNLASLSALYKLGVLYEQEGKYPEARATLEKVGQQQPTSVPLLIELARVADQQNDNKGALGYLAHARDLEPNNAAIHFFFGMVCVKENLAEEAYRSLRKAVTLDPNNAIYNYAYASVAVDRNNPGESIPYFRKYIELKPQDLRGRFALGCAYFYSHDDEKARKELLQVVNIPETAAGAHYFLARVANHQGQYAEALRDLQVALKLNPKLANAYAEMGLVYMKQRQYAEAEKSLRRALELEPGSYTANLNLMILYQRTKDPRADEQAKKFEKIRAERAERAKEFLRAVVVQP